MDITNYNAFTQKLADNLQSDPRVLGLVALGSMAQTNRLPDSWSDHDFFVVTQHSVQEGFRQDLSWLPDAANIVLQVRETAHGLKVLYQNAHIIEFAIFDEQELHLAKVNDYRVIFDRANINAQMAQIVRDSSAEADHFDAERAYAIFLSLLLIGAGRAARGEIISAHQFVKQFALGELTALLVRHLPPAAGAQLDNLNPTRRFERAYPALAAELNAVLLLEPLSSARSLLALADRELRNRLSNYPSAAVEVVQRYLADRLT
jgi:lincosamide nucleotidyltransferase B/F